MLAPDGAFEIHNYKTGSKLPEQKELDEDMQLALYQIGVQNLWPKAGGGTARRVRSGVQHHWDLCPAKKHLVKVEALPRDRWKDEPRVVIVDTDAEKWRKKKGLEAETKTVKREDGGAP